MERNIRSLADINANVSIYIHTYIHTSFIVLFGKSTIITCPRVARLI